MTALRPTRSVIERGTMPESGRSLISTSADKEALTRRPRCGVTSTRRRQRLALASQVRPVDKRPPSDFNSEAESLKHETEREALGKRIGGNRHDNEVGKCRLCAFACVLWLGRDRSYRIGAGPVRLRAPARRSAIAGASAAVGLARPRRRVSGRSLCSRISMSSRRASFSRVVPSTRKAIFGLSRSAAAGCPILLPT
jgi:hypothetical protein